jgi:hypothetical protein
MAYPGREGKAFPRRDRLEPLRDKGQLSPVGPPTSATPCMPPIAANTGTVARNRGSRPRSEDRAGEAGREAVISNQQPVISDQ